MEQIAVIGDKKDARHFSLRHANVTAFDDTEEFHTSQTELSKVDVPSKNKPFFVMHIGPLKTGTTTLQCSLQSLSRNLEMDGIVIAETESCRPDIDTTTFKNYTWTKGGEATYDNVVLGKAFAPNCLGQWDDESASGMPDCWMNSYVKFAREHALQNHSVVLSNEILSQTMSQFPRTFVDDLVDSLDAHFQIVIVVTYRPWFEWVASLQDQMTKNILVRQRDWPENGGRRMESLHKFIERQLRQRKRPSLTKQQQQKCPFVDEIIPIFQNHSSVKLKIVDIHEEGDFVTNFVCKTLSGRATTTCDILKSTRIGDKNKAENKLWYDMLAVEAYEKGLVSGSRLRVYNKIRKFQETTLEKSSTDFDKTCPPSGFLKRIERESIRITKKIWPDPSLDWKLEREHRAAFARAVEAEKFCTINATAVLEDPQWLDFFKSLKRRRGQRKQTIS